MLALVTQFTGVWYNQNSIINLLFYYYYFGQKDFVYILWEIMVNPNTFQDNCCISKTKNVKKRRQAIDLNISNPRYNR